MSESEQRMNNTQSENGANTSEQRWDLAPCFQPKEIPENHRNGWGVRCYTSP